MNCFVLKHLDQFNYFIRLSKAANDSSNTSARASEGVRGVAQQCAVRGEQDAINMKTTYLSRTKYKSKAP